MGRWSTCWLRLTVACRRHPQVVKSYPTGNVSKYIGTLKAGDSIEVKGCTKKYGLPSNVMALITSVCG